MNCVSESQEAIEEARFSLARFADPVDPIDPKFQSAAWGEIGQAHLQLRRLRSGRRMLSDALRLNPENGMAV